MSGVKPALIIHGHFYQPPRESPWTEVLDREPSAAPAHDWNERIYEECYRPNAYTRIVDGFSRVERVIDTYSLISFNFGPTLLSWMERHHAGTYRRIVDADRLSRQKNAGHGNAIAQGYNHTILPLMTPRDRKTQIRWGLADFRRRFGREPESMWLPETACNDETLQDLIDEGLRYVILSPHQAECVRPIGTAEWRDGTTEWRDVSSGTVDTSVPYRWVHPDGSGRSITLFFYQGAIAQAVAFEGALNSSQGFIDHLKRWSRGPMVNVATDGETYGHHVKAGDRTLAYALSELARPAGFRVTNYGAFLDDHPPRHEAIIKKGADGLGTAWSCSHGVGRWYRDCGCTTSGREGWNQAWRKPLRSALDLLRDEVAEIFEEEGAALLGEPWAARDAYIDVILDRKLTDPFLAAHGRQSLSEEQKIRALTLLEIQRSSQLTYTSCGWFFSEISGLESVQVLKYAGRALDLIEELGVPSPRERFLEVLSEAQSNLPEMGNGADVFRRFVEPARVTPKRLAAHHAISSLVSEEFESSGEVGGCAFRAEEVEKRQHGRVRLLTARVHLEAITTRRVSDWAVSAMHLGGADFYCAVKPYEGVQQYREAAQKIWAAFRTASLPVLLRIAQESFGPEEFGLDGILPDAREWVADTVFRDLVRRFSEQYAAMYEDHRRTFELLQSAGFTLPAELRAAAEFTLGRRFEEEILAHRSSTDPDAYKKAIEIAEEVAKRGFQIDRSAARQIFTGMITDAVWRTLDSDGEEDLDSAIALLELTHRLGIDANLSRAQEALYERRAAIPKNHPLRRLAGPLKLSPLVFPDEQAVQPKSDPPPAPSPKDAMASGSPMVAIKRDELPS